MLSKVLRLSCAVFLLAMSVRLNAQVQYQVLYNFGASGPNDGTQSEGKLVADGVGNLYGTTKGGGVNGEGTVFELSPSSGGQWSETVIYNFCSQPGCSDGQFPSAGLIFDEAGNLYGTTLQGGLTLGCCFGTVFELLPPPVPGGAWTETVLYAFRGSSAGDGCYPEGKLIFDSARNLYGTTSQCGAGQQAAGGTVFELVPTGDGTWQEIVLYSFCQASGKCPGGAAPLAGVSFRNGNLYGTASEGGPSKGGVIYELSPSLGSGWTETVLHSFGSGTKGKEPRSSINFDQVGNLYGTTYTGGLSSQACDFGCGSVFRLVGTSGSWKYSALRFTGPDGGNPAAGLSMDIKHKTVYGTTEFGGLQLAGTVFKIHGMTETVLYNFCSQSNCVDGSQPTTALISDTSGHLYGTTTRGGAFGQGVVFEITQ